MTRILVLAGAVLASASAADIPIRQVILYKSGVGYFERAGRLGPGESGRLDFKASDMNDVLKSLTLEDAGGKVTGLRYDSSEPLAAKLADFPFKVEGQASLAVFMDQMKGAKVEIKYGAETVTGAIVSGRLVVGSDEKHPEREQAVLMLDSGDLRTFDLAAASTLRFTDPKLQSQLRDYLALVNQSRSQDKRSIYIDSSDSKERQIAASYMVPMPVWKSSYRLIFNDKTDPTLEGWAIVDNTTGEDWTNVVLSVVSGRPVSFISKLYEPKYAARQTVELPEDRAAAPVVYGGVVGGVPAGAAGGMGPRPAPMQGSALNRTGVVGDLNEQFMRRQDAKSSVSVDVASADLGELFEYRFSTPVTVKKDQSTMLPFLQQKIGARKLLIYSESYGEHPMSAAELTNSTGKTLDGGPITVFESASYSGEALMTTLKASDKRLISYAVDLGTRVTTAYDSSRAVVREIHVNRGVLTARSAVQETRTYTIRNVDSKAKTLIIEQTQQPEYHVLNPKPTETTSSANRFEVKLGPDSSEKFPIVQERVFDTTNSVSNLSPDVLFGYVQNKAISDAGRRQLQQVVDVARQIADLDSQAHQAETDIKNLVDDQARIRQNIQSLNAVSGQQEQVQKYARQLADQESQLAAQRDRDSNLRKQKTTQQSNWNDLIAKLEF